MLAAVAGNDVLIAAYVSAAGAVVAAALTLVGNWRLNDTKHAVGVVTDKVDAHDDVLSEIQTNVNGALEQAKKAPAESKPEAGQEEEKQ